MLGGVVVVLHVCDLDASLYFKLKQMKSLDQVSSLCVLIGGP